MYTDALARAKKVDAYMAETGKPIGPLHGLPISLKDGINIKGDSDAPAHAIVRKLTLERPGYASAFGFVSGCFKPEQSDSALVKVLLDLGAVSYVKTTTPPATMLWATWSNVSP